MAFDHRRNQSYRRAMAAIIDSQTCVLDVGAGIGILGLMAAQLGARKVYCVEPENTIALGREFAKDNGIENKMDFLQGKIEEIKLPEPVDLIVSALTGNFLLAEDLLPSLFYARDHFLKSGGCLLPNEAVMACVPVNAPILFQREITGWSAPSQGLCLAAARTYAANTMVFDSPALRDANYLAEPIELTAMNFAVCQDASCDTEAKFIVQTSGECHGIAGWFRMHLGDQWLSTAPHEPTLHWSAAFLPLDPPISLHAGDEMYLRLIRPAYGSWSWRVEAGGKQRQASTLLGECRTAKSVSKSSPDFQPRLNDKGRAAALVLRYADGTRSMARIATQLSEQFPRLYGDRNKSLQFVRNILHQCC